jgi:hypothetical protein
LQRPNHQVSSLDGRLKNYDAGLELKASQKTLRMLRHHGHPDAELLEQHVWKFRDFSWKDFKRELDMVVTGDV